MKNIPSTIYSSYGYDILKKLIGFRSISTNPQNARDVQETAQWLVDELIRLGFDAYVTRAPGHPLVCATYRTPKARVTKGFYAHYDVQPEGPTEAWHSKGFALTQKNNHLFGRGTADDKGHIAQLLAACKRAIEQKTIANNIVVIFEGEEESGSIHFEEAVQDVHQDTRTADVWYVLDSGVKDEHTPELLYGLRGLMEYELFIETSTHDLHSGLYGNSVANPLALLINFLSSLTNDNLHITLPHFYDRVIPATKKEEALLKAAKGSAEQEKKHAGIEDFYIPKGYTYYTATKVFPSFEIHGIRGGFTGEGFMTVIPARASAKFSFRLVPDQRPAEIHRALQSYTANYFKNIPAHVKIVNHSNASPFVTSLDNRFVTEIQRIFSRHFSRQMVCNRSGGSIPAAEVLSRLYQKPVLATGFTSPDSNLHGPNEHISIGLFSIGSAILYDLLTV